MADQVSANAPSAEPTNVNPAAAAQPTKEQASEVNERLLKESKEWKAKAQQYEQQLKAEAEKKGDYKALYEAEAQRVAELAKRRKADVIKNSIESMAAKAGCVDSDALLVLGNKELLQYDDENEKVYGVDAFIEEAKKARSYLFKSAANAAVVNAAAPGGSVEKKQLTLEQIGKLPASQKAEYYAKLLKNK
jgi:hypothetical protein